MRYIDADKITLRVSCGFDSEGEILVSARDVYKSISQTPTENPYEWISVEDRLPDVSGSYIVATSNGAVCTAKFWCVTPTMKPHWNGTVAKYITHWMPMPMHPGAIQ